MSALLKLLPAAAVGLVAYANSDELAKSLNIITKVQVAATAGIEMQGIAEAVAQEYTSEGTLPVDNFGKFLRENMRERGGKNTRDRTKDVWGTEYKLIVKGEGFEVQSAGPDTKWNTDDDLKYFYSIKELGGPGADVAAGSGQSGSSGKASHSSTANQRRSSPSPAQTPSTQSPEETKRKVVESQMKRAEGGSAQAQYDLGLRYLSGDGVGKDDAKAREWLEKSAEGGNSEAKRKLESLNAGKL